MDALINAIKTHIQQSLQAKQVLLNSPLFLENIAAIAKKCQQVIQGGNKILLAGNGGSAADAQHIAAELVGRFEKERPSLAGIALTTDTSALTAIANDYGYEQVFSRQLQGLGREGDLFIGISTSGNSANIIEAVKVAKLLDIHTLALTGSGGTLKTLADDCIAIPAERTAIVQECHIMIGHILCAMIDQNQQEQHPQKHQ